MESAQEPARPLPEKPRLEVVPVTKDPNSGPVETTSLTEIPKVLRDRFKALCESEGWTYAQGLTAFCDYHDSLESLDIEVGKLREEGIRWQDRVGRARKELSALEAQREAQEEKLTDLRYMLSRNVGLSQSAIELLQSLLEAGADRASILAWGQSLLAAKVEPSVAAQIMERIGGLSTWAAKIKEAVDTAELVRDQLGTEIGARRQALQRLIQQAESADKAIRLAGKELEQSRMEAVQIRAVASDLGVYVAEVSDWTKGGGIATMPAGVARVVAGGILLSAVAQVLDEGGQEPVFTLIPDARMGGGRVLPTKLRMSEIPTLLASANEYQVFLDHLRQRQGALQQAMAGLGETPSPTQGAAEQTAEESLFERDAASGE